MTQLLDNLLRKDQGSYTLANETAQLICELVKNKKFTYIQQLVNNIFQLKLHLKKRYPLEFTVRNVLMKSLYIILETCEETKVDPFYIPECFSKLKLKSKTQSYIAPKAVMEDNDFSNLIENYKDDDFLSKDTTDSISIANFKDILIISLQDNLTDEINNLSDNLKKYAVTHINSHEIILTFDCSETIFNFFQEGKKTRDFEVIVVDSSINKSGSQMATRLSEIGIKTALIPETSVYAVMTRIHKVFIGATGIMNNGGAITSSGTILVAMAAHSFSVPLIIISAIYKLTPKFPLDQGTFNEMIPPSQIFEEYGIQSNEMPDVLVDKYNYIEPQYIWLYITNIGEHTPAQTYRMFNKYYGKEEYTKNIKKFYKMYKEKPNLDNF